MSNRTRTILYWIATVYIVVSSAISGTMDIFRLQPLFGILIHLGYPAYFGGILGTWKILGAIALTAPRYPRLKEWAYAGMFIDFTAAAASHLTVGDGPVALAGPFFSILCLIASWALRPASRRLPFDQKGAVAVASRDARLVGDD